LLALKVKRLYRLVKQTNGLYLNHIDDFEWEKALPSRFKPHAGGMPRHAKHGWIAALKASLELRGCPGLFGAACIQFATCSSGSYF
jgi:hypothetical protein